MRFALTMRTFLIVLAATASLQAFAIGCPQPKTVPINGRMVAVGAGGCKMLTDKHGVTAPHRGDTDIPDCNLRITEMKCELKDGTKAVVTYYSDYINTRNQPVLCLTTLPNSGFRSEKEDNECSAIGAKASKDPSVWWTRPTDVGDDQPTDRALPTTRTSGS